MNLGSLAELEIDGPINEAALLEHGLIRGRYDGIKILGTGDLTKKLTWKPITSAPPPARRSKRPAAR